LCLARDLSSSGGSVTGERTALTAPDALPRQGAGGERPGAAPKKGLLRERFDAMKDTAIDDAMGMSDSWAKKVGYGNHGVLLDYIPRLIATLGLKIVDASRICITAEQIEEYEAYKVIAKRHLVPESPKLDQDFDQ
jgi:hypothetical protein